MDNDASLPQTPMPDLAGRSEVPEEWFADAPMFIDPELVASLYNALLLPEYEHDKFTLDASKVRTASVRGEATAEISTSGSVFAKLLSPIGLRGDLKAEKGKETSQEEGQTLELRAVQSPEARLVNLIAFFAAEFSDHIWYLEGLEDNRWWEDTDFSRSLPKPLLFVDLHEDTPIVPMAAELDDGETVLFYERITKAVAVAGDVLPLEYPNRDEVDAVRKYWAWYKEHPDSSRGAMHVIEEAITSGGSPRWIDYRVPMGSPTNAIDSLHLHMQARGRYATGDFAYRFVHRGRKHGLRIVGSLQAGPALNVLAVYEK